MSEAVKYFTEFLKSENFRVTPERLAVLETVLEYRNHFDADELFLKMKMQGSTISRATVYNTLDKLTQCGILSRTRFGKNLARYEVIFGSKPHHHVICRSCGKIEEFFDPRVDRLARDAARTMNYTLDDYFLHIFGLCSTCAKIQTKGKTT